MQTFAVTFASNMLKNRWLLVGIGLLVLNRNFVFCSFFSRIVFVACF